MKHKYLFLSLVFLLSFLSLNAQDLPLAEKSNILKEQALDSARNNNLESALELISESVRLYPHETNVVLKGEIAYALKRYEVVDKMSDDLSPLPFEILKIQISAWNDRHLENKSLEILDDIIVEFPSYDLYKLRAQTYESQSNYESELEDLTTLLKYPEAEPVVFYKMANILSQKFERYSESIRYYEEYIDLNPNASYGIWFELGEAYEKTKNKKKAEECYKIATRRMNALFGF